MNEISGGNKKGQMNVSFYSFRAPRFISLRVCPVLRVTNRITVQHLINYPAALIQYRLKYNAPELSVKLNEFNLFESRIGGLPRMIQSVQCNRRTD
jgi:hypothetical protein